MVCTILTVIAAFINLGNLNFPVALTIAVFKATLVVLFFMHVKYRQPDDEADRRGRVLLPGDPADADVVRLSVARMVYVAARIDSGRRDYQPDRARSRPVRGRSRQTPQNNSPTVRRQHQWLARLAA